MASVYLVRHGESTWNAERRWAGHADPPLSELGREQAMAACDTFMVMGFSAVASSSMKRARETAEIIATRLKLPNPFAISDFNERNAGQISGLTSDEIESKFPGILDEWRKGNPIEMPGGESWADFVNRIIRGFAELGRYECERVLLVSHDGVLRAIAYRLNEPHTRRGNLQGRWLEISSLMD
jgi:broad specificity phosphatase PhoE